MHRGYGGQQGSYLSTSNYPHQQNRLVRKLRDEVPFILAAEHAHGS